jgi:hypothetical protein
VVRKRQGKPGNKPEDFDTLRYFYIGGVRVEVRLRDLSNAGDLRGLVEEEDERLADQLL